MKRLVLIAFLATSCSETAYLSKTGYVSHIDQKRNVYTVFFPCENVRYKNQLCGAWLDFKLDSTVTLMQKFDVK
jgi:hypothetical protein